MTATEWNRVLLVVVVVETCMLIEARYESRRVKRPTLPELEAMNPLALALDYESPASKFEALVKANPGWVTYRQKNHFPDVAEVMPVLAGCALMGYSNHVEVLLKYGADAEEAIQWLRQNAAGEGVPLIADRIRQRGAGVEIGVTGTPVQE